MWDQAPVLHWQSLVRHSAEYLSFSLSLSSPPPLSLSLSLSLPPPLSLSLSLSLGLPLSISLSHILGVFPVSESSISFMNKRFTVLYLQHFDNNVEYIIASYCSFTIPIHFDAPHATKKRMARIILGAHQLTPTVQVFRRLHWVSVEKRWTFHKCKMMYHVLNNFGPSYLSNILIRSQTLHNHNTRNATNFGLALPLSRTKMGKLAFSHEGAALWNQLPFCVRQAQSKHSFANLYWRTLRLWLFLIHFLVLSVKI